MTPSPMNPSFAIRPPVRKYRCLVSTLRRDFGPSRRVLAVRRGLRAGRKLRILAHLLEMSAHCVARHLRVVALDRLENTLVMKLPTLRAAFDVEDFYTLLAQQSNNGIDQGQNQRIGRRFGQRQME